MSERDRTFEGVDHTEGAWAAYARATSRYGRRHHDQDDRWSRHAPVQDAD